MAEKKALQRGLWIGTACAALVVCGVTAGREERAQTVFGQTAAETAETTETAETCADVTFSDLAERLAGGRRP